MLRKIVKIHKPLEAHMPGLSTWQALPNATLEYLDPFILLNHHGPETFEPNNRGLPFGPHPHRGFETLTFIFKGDIVHEDSTGQRHVSGPGDVQWMTAGRGIIHSEVSSEEFKKQGGPIEILQLWMNLPSRLKMTAPDYKGYAARELGFLSLDDGRVKAHVISGQIAGQKGPHSPLTDLTLGYVHLSPQGRFTQKIPKGHTVFLYVVQGSLTADGQQLKKHNLAEFEKEGEELDLTAQEPSLILFGHGQPLNEPKAAQGPFVMNTVGELKQAFLDYQAGKFT
jgi:redox-sensitive bicupin YhaK (pirin superfamily)